MLRYLTAPVAVALALLLELLLWPIMQQSRSPLFFIAVMAAAWLGGFGPGLLATVLSALVLIYFFTPPEYSWNIGALDGLRLLVFVLVAVAISVMTARQRWARQERELLLDLAEQAREEEQRNREQLAATTRQLDRALAEAELLNNIAHAITGEAKVEIILSTALAHLQPLIAFTGGAIALVEEDHLVIRAALGPHAATALGQSLPHGRGRLWQVIETGEPFLEGDLEATTYQPTTPLRSYLAVPLTWQGRILGLLEIDSIEPHAFDEADLPLVQRVAALLSGPIEMARRYAAEVHAVAAAEAAQKRLMIQYALSVLLAESAHFNDAAPWILKIVGEHLGWDLGAIWCIDREANVLRCSNFWQKSGMKAQAFEAASRQLTFAPGVGLPGQVWATRAPLWIDDLPNAEGFTRQVVADEEGLRSAFAFPIQSHQNFFGVIEFFIRASQPPDEILFQMGTAIGIQLGQYIDGKRAEAAARQSHAREGAILEAALDGIITIDQEGKITEFNPAAERIFGYARNEVLGREMAALLIPPARRAAHWAGMAHYLATGESQLLGRRFEIEAMRADGTLFPIELAICRIPSDRSPLFTGFVRDITEHKRTEGERTHLLESEQQARADAEAAQQRLAFLAEASTLLTFSLDYRETLTNLVQLVVPDLADYCLIDVLEDGVLQRVKAVHADPAKEQVMQALQANYPPKLDAPVGVAQVLRMGRAILAPDVEDEQLVAAAQDAEHLRLLRELGPRSSMILPLISPSRTMGIITLAITTSPRRYDAADLALAEELARRAALAADNARLYQEAQEAIEARDRFFSIASHELKTPITTIKGFVDILERREAREGAGSASNARALHIIGRESTRLNRLIDLLLDLSRIQEDRFYLQMKEMDLRPLLLRLIEITQPALEAHTLLLHCKEEALPLEGDELRLEQALHNLIQNAIKYSPEGGAITIEAASQNGQITLSISDQGIGIPADALPRLFHRFYRGENAEALGIGGMGMGLYVVRHIIEAHGGTIEVESREGEGTTFTVTLPGGETHVLDG